MTPKAFTAASCVTPSTKISIFRYTNFTTYNVAVKSVDKFSPVIFPNQSSSTTRPACTNLRSSFQYSLNYSVRWIVGINLIIKIYPSRPLIGINSRVICLCRKKISYDTVHFARFSFCMSYKRMILAVYFFSHIGSVSSYGIFNVKPSSTSTYF